MDTSQTPAADPLRARAQSGVSWFFWIAGLSLVNSIVAATGSSWGFMAGLGVTQLIDGIALSVGATATPIALGLDVCVAGAFVGLGIWASRSRTGYLVGTILYALDGVLFALVQDWVGLGFHGFVLFFLVRGYTARRALDAMPAVAAAEEPTRQAA